MKIKNLFQTCGDDRAVSPVIGVILMVAITVILAAVIGTFVLGLGDQVQTTAPNTNIAFDYSNNHQDGSHDVLEVTHDGGDGVPANELAASVSNAGTWDTDVGNDGVDDDNPGYAGSTTAYDPTDAQDIFGEGSENVQAGDSYDLTYDGGNNGFSLADDTTDGDQYLALHGATVRVVWQGDGDQSSTLRTWDGPDA